MLRQRIDFIPALLQRMGSRAARSLVRRWSEQLRLPPDPWVALRMELDRWHGNPARFWWRDDDAIRVTPQIERLLDIRRALDVPVALAVIPAGVQPCLASVLRDHPQVGVLAHGWSHCNHAPVGRPLAELASGRNPGDVFLELYAGRRRLEDDFGGQFWPVQVPPYNCLAPDLVEAVVQAGFAYVSINTDFAGIPVPLRNVQIDVIKCADSRAARATSIVRDAVAALRMRRYGLVDARTPIGVMTHHLVHDEETWKVTEDLLRRLVAHEAVVFPPIAAIFSGLTPSQDANSVHSRGSHHDLRR